MEGDFEAATERPQQLEHGDIKGKAGHREPYPGGIVVDPLIHTDEEADDDESISRTDKTVDTDTAADWEVLETPTPGL